MKTRLLITAILFFSVVFYSNALIQNVIPDSTTYYTNQVNKALWQHKTFPYKSYQVLKKSRSYFQRSKDTTMVIKCLMHMSEMRMQRGKYSLAFDHAWEGLYLANKSQKGEEMARTHIQLARLYDMFSMDDEVYSHLREALKIAKELYFQDNEKVGPLISSYMNLAVKERKSGNFKVALKHLDSCLVNEKVIERKQVEMPFMDAERGYIMLKLGNYEESSKYLHSSNKHTLNKAVDYKTNIAMYLGELKDALNQSDSALFYYKRSLNYINRKNYRADLKPEVLYKLSEIYYKKKQSIKAYNYLEQSHKAADSMQQLRNKTNGELFEIKDSYLQSIYEKNEQLAKRDLVIAQNEQVQFRLKAILAFVVLLIAVILVIYRMRIKLKRTLMDKRESELQSKLKEEQINAKIESKSKELTSYALQLIDKEKDIEELLDVLKKESPQSYKALSYKYTKGSKDLWDTFNLRFTEVNSKFYEKLKTKHPDLSVTERKHCALIKLNFGTKEMARILNIEPHSVHISRSRIRKKIGLERAEKLENYISGF
ncbi:hypothetical protein [Seonamhaeicola marinus]|uniref:HTH luxR-type domain-containing protein n=1 Tax=Seonamhaeicola marinus TaxID=1912246 RepID=A0A5D0HS36_9FLAO|nr:hypothetical protein [Seonamhaeicola marinus]TYA74154.1 hypothetical protein FUA24_12505 [Seonamhaeicola marinus]